MRDKQADTKWPGAADSGASEKRAALKNRPWELFGFGMQYAWVFSAVFGWNLYAYSADAAWACWCRVALLVGMAVAYFTFFLLRKKTPIAKINPQLLMAAGAFGVLGSALLVIPSSGAQMVLILVASALLCGFGSAIMMLDGDVLWAGCRPERAMMHIAPSTLLAIVLYYLISLLPSVVAAGVVCLLPLAGGLILFSTKKGKARSGSYRHIEEDRDLGHRHIIAVSAAALIAGLALGVLSRAGFAESQGLVLEGFLGLAIGAFVAVVLAVRNGPSKFLQQLDGMGMPCLQAGAVVLVALMGAWPDYDVWLGCALILGGYIFSDMGMWLLSAELAFRMRKSASDLLARTACAQWAAMAVGFSAAIVVPDREFLIICVGVAAIILIGVRSYVFTPQAALRLIEARDASASVDILQEAYGIVAERYGLTARETEVFAMLAQGRSGSYIQENLSLSESTVKTHVRHIYDKLGIGGKQELIDLVQREC